MEVINKIVISTNPPRENYVLWANPNTHQLYYWNNGWQTFFYDKKDEKQNKYDLNLLTKRKEITGAINELFSMVKGMDITIDLTPVAKEETLTQGISTLSQKIDDIPATDLTPVAKEQTLLGKAEEIVTEVQKVNDAQAMIDELLAIQLQTIIGGEE